MNHSTSFILALIFFVSINCSPKSTQPENMVTTASGLQYEILKKGSGKHAKEGQEVIVNERMGYRDGTELYSSYGSPNPPKFKLGANQAIEGVDEGVKGMQIGEIRKLIVPPSLSKRSRYPDFLSPDSILVYKIELVDIVEEN